MIFKVITKITQKTNLLTQTNILCITRFQSIGFIYETQMGEIVLTDWKKLNQRKHIIY